MGRFKGSRARRMGDSETLGQCRRNCAARLSYRRCKPPTSGISNTAPLSGDCRARVSGTSSSNPGCVLAPPIEFPRRYSSCRHFSRSSIRRTGARWVTGVRPEETHSGVCVSFQVATAPRGRIEQSIRASGAKILQRRPFACNLAIGLLSGGRQPESLRLFLRVVTQCLNGRKI